MCIYVRVSKTFCLRWLCHDFPIKMCSIKVSTNFVWEPFCVPQKFWYRKNLWTRARKRCREGGREGGKEGGIISFCVKNLMAHSTEKLRRGNLLCCTKFNFCYRKMLRIRGARVSQFSVKLFCLTIPNHLVEECFFVSESFGYQRKLCLRGEYHDFL